MQRGRGPPQKGRGAPVVVLNTNMKRDAGPSAQLGNIRAAKAVSAVVRTCLGPRAMLKMLLDPIGGIVLTNDGNAILREIDVSHPGAKNVIELSRTQDDEAGDGTTSVIILAGEVLAVAEPWLEKKLHATIIISAYYKALRYALAHIERIAQPVNVASDEEMLSIISSSIGTKFINRWSKQMCQMALDAVRIVTETQKEKTMVDLKHFVRIERIPGGELGDSRVVRGCILNKDVLHSKMRRRIENPRIVLLDCPLEYKKLENQASMEFSNEDDFKRALEIEEQTVKQMCEDILKFKPDLIITEKGCSDLAQHYFVRAGVTALRRLRKTDNNRLARATGATIVHRPDELKESDIGTKCGLFEVRKIGDEYFSFIEECEDPGACTILLRGATKDVLREVERNMQDALHVARNIVYDSRLLPGGGATEMSVSYALIEKSKSIEGVEQWPFHSLALAFEVIPRTLAQNCGARVVRVLTELRAKHASDPLQNCRWGINGETGELTDMADLGVWEPFAVKAQVIKSAIENACMLMRVDEVLSGLSKKGGGGGGGGPPQMDMPQQ